MDKKNISNNILKIIIIISLICLVIIGVYLYINRDYIDFSSLMGNSSVTVYNEKAAKLQNDNSIYTVTFNPNSKKKVNGTWYFTQNKTTNGNNFINYIFNKAGFSDKYKKHKISLFYKGKQIKSGNASYNFFTIKQSWGGYTVVVRLSAYQNSNKIEYKYLKLHIPKALNLNTIKFNKEYYYIVKNAKEFYDYERNKMFYQDARDYWGDSCLGFSMVYANAIKTNNFSIISNQPGLVDGNDAHIVGINGFKRGTSFDKKKVVQFVYKQLIKNNPVVLQVNGDDAGTSRHYVVVIGYRVNFDVNKMNESDFLILDVWDGTSQVMSGKGGNNARGDKSRFMITGKDTKIYNPDRNYGYEVYYIY